MPYDFISGRRYDETIDYTVAQDPNNPLYPDTSNISIFGPIWLPRIYGKDLTAFEIASSGKIAITLSNIHALDFSRDNAGVTKLQGLSNDSFEINVNQSNEMRMLFDSTTNDVSLLASNNFVVETSNNIEFSASNNFVLDTSNDISLTANSGRFLLNTVSSNATLILDSDYTTSLYSSNNVNVTTSNEYVLTAYSNINLTSTVGDINIIGEGANTSIKLLTDQSNIETYSSNNTIVRTSNSFNVFSHCNVSVHANGTGFVILDTDSTHTQFQMNSNDSHDIFAYASNDINLSASNDFTSVSHSNTYITAHNGDIQLTTNTSNTYQRFEHSNVTLYAVSNILITASNNFYLDTAKAVTISTSNDDLGIYANKSNMFLKMLASNNKTYLYSSNDINIDTSNSTKIVVGSNIHTQTLAGNYTIQAYSNYRLYADSTSNMGLEMLKTGDVVNLYSISNVRIVGSNDVSIYGNCNLSITTHSNLYVGSASNSIYSSSNDTLVSASNDLTLSAKNTLTFAGKDLAFNMSGDMTYTALSNVFYKISSTPLQPSEPILQITGSNIAVRGDLFISGSINTTQIVNTTVIESNLAINDKLIILAASDNSNNDVMGDSNPLDGDINNGAGILVDGIPEPYKDNSCNNLWPIYEKSIKWNYGVNGTLDLQTSNLTTESAWEFRGGGLRITTASNMDGIGVKDLSFTWRINEAQELELIKTFFDINANNYIWKRVAKFGRIL